MDCDLRGQQGLDFFHWRIMDYELDIFARSNRLKLKPIKDGFVLRTRSFSLHKMLTDVVFLWIIVMFLSAVWTLILTAPIHCRGFIGEQEM